MFYKNIIVLENLSSLKYIWNIIFLFAWGGVLKRRGAYLNYLFSAAAAPFLKKFKNMQLWAVHGLIALLILINMLSIVSIATTYKLCASDSIYCLSGLIKTNPHKITLLLEKPQHINYAEIYFIKNDLFIFLKHYYINYIYNSKLDLIINYSVDGDIIQYKHKNLFLLLLLTLGGVAAQLGTRPKSSGIV